MFRLCIRVVLYIGIFKGGSRRSATPYFSLSLITIVEYIQGFFICTRIPSIHCNSRIRTNSIITQRSRYIYDAKRFFFLFFLHKLIHVANGQLRSHDNCVIDYPRIQYLPSHSTQWKIIITTVTHIICVSLVSNTKSNWIKVKSNNQSTRYFPSVSKYRLFIVDYRYIDPCVSTIKGNDYNAI